MISGTWKLPIILHLLDGTKRFIELRRLLPGIGRAMLSFELRQLAVDGIVKRTQYETIQRFRRQSNTTLPRRDRN